MYTGDEMGFMIRWDISRLVEKLDSLKPPSEGESGQKNAQKLQKGKSTFMTGFNDEISKLQFLEEDIVQLERWKAHDDLINQVTFVPELEVVSTCSFDCNVKMWNKTTCKQVGSLVLGTGSSSSQEQSQAEKMKYSNIWKIKIDKTPRFNKDRDEATEMLEKAEEMKYETMFLKGPKEKQAYEEQKALEEAQQKDPKSAPKKRELPKQEIEIPDKTDEEILQDIRN